MDVTAETCMMYMMMAGICMMYVMAGNVKRRRDPGEPVREHYLPGGTT